MSESLLIKGGTVLDGLGGAPEKKDVFIHRGVITEVCDPTGNVIERSDTKVIDAKGAWVTPGLIDAHCHISYDEPLNNDEIFSHRRSGLATLVASVNAQKVLRAGFTSLFDANCIFDVGIDLRDAVEAGVVQGPNIATGGNVLISSVGGTAARLLPDSGRGGYAAITRTNDDIVREIHRQAKLGVDWIKVHVSGLPVRPWKSKGEIKTWTFDQLRLIVETAHCLEIPVVGHCRSADSTYEAVLAGFDLILHATHMDERALEAVIEHKTPLVPTLTFQANLAEFGHLIGSDPRLQDIFKREIADSAPYFRRAHEQGVPLITGSESGFSITPYGDWHYRELEIFVDEIGLTPMEALQSATSAASYVMKKEDSLGAILPGYQADILVLNNNPLKDIGIFKDPSSFRHIIKSGSLVDLECKIPGDWAIPGWRVAPFSNQKLTRELVGSVINGGPLS